MKKLVILLAFICFEKVAYAQVAYKDSLRAVLKTEITEEERAKTLHRLFSKLVNSVPDSALLCVEEAFKLTEKLGNIKLHGRSYSQMGHALYVNNKMDLFQSSLKSYIVYLEKTNQEHEIAAVYRNLSKVGERTQQPDSSLFYIEKCLNMLALYPDSTVMIDVYISKGMAYKNKAYFELSIEAHLNALRIAELKKNTKKLAYVHLNLGSTYNQMDRFDDGILHYEKADFYFKEQNNLGGQSHVLNNLGQVYRKKKRWKDAEKAHLESIQHAEQMKFDFNILMNHINLVKLYFETEAFDKCTPHLDAAERIAKKIDNNFTEGAVIRYRTRIALKEGEIRKARRYAIDAEKYVLGFNDPIEEKEIYFEMAEIKEGLKEYKSSLSFLKKGHQAFDSIYTVQTDKQFAELDLIYKTEKKDAEIVLLNKQTELDATRKKGLWAGLGLLALLAASIIYSLIQKKKKEKAILTQEKDAEKQKRQLAEQELEFKKKELTAKALQLARKNEFLHKLESEVDSLTSSIDASVGKTSGRISRMIHRDSVDDEEWEQFGKEFSSVHQDFLDRIKRKFGMFSKSEMRLIALLKMNLSSKDIASTLRISADGIKKARYRLRKKLELDSEVDLQGYLMAF